MREIGVLIVDDEEPARIRLHDLLVNEKDIAILGEASCGADAVEAIEALSPQVVFLDIQMPDMTGLEVIRTVGPEHMPWVVMVTAFDQYAIQAFDLCALDYLLKPFDDERFHAALVRIRERLRLANMDQFNQKLVSLLSEMEGRATSQGTTQAATGSPNRAKPSAANQTGATQFGVKHNGRLVLLNPEQIDYISAEGPYARIHTPARNYLIRERMKSLETRLGNHGFFRIHRSTIVNMERIDCLTPSLHGDYKVILKDGTSLELGRSRRRALTEQLELMG